MVKLFNVPYGQFWRLRKNCTLDKDFEKQSHTMSNRFNKKLKLPAYRKKLAFFQVKGLTNNHLH